MLAVAVAASCNDSRQQLKYARSSLYDTDFAIVYAAALDATRNIYPNLDENPGPGKISTSWHQVQFANCSSGPGSQCDDSTGGMANQQVLAQQQGLGQGSPAQGIGNQNGAMQAGMPTRLAYKKYFIRFDVAVLGGRPWRVKVVGHASSWDPGAAMPTELHGADKPHWLEGRTQALQIAIYKKVAKYAVPAPDDEDDKPKDTDKVKTDPTTFKNVPIGAAKQLALIKDAIAKRDYASMRPALADDVVWSLGGGTGADAAMAMWQADPSALDAMLATLATCATEAGDKRIACPAGTVQPGQWQLVLEPRGDFWMVTSFVKAE
ncbi:MAG TPA: nuclear transport factor 2 family protein [Kofleriaceae bacterium]|nr:nuclear transport factor 2 family protein [Kofleriaceae bacterium]